MKKLFAKFETIQLRPYTIDLIVLVLLYLIVAFYALWFIDFKGHPIEDAAMLMRYSQHFADGHGVVWNIGEAPVDGATDFLFMIAVGVLVKAGISLDFATRFLGFAAHFLTITVIFFSLRRTFNAPRVIAFGTGAFLIAGPGFFYVVGYFGTTVFALFACLSWWLALDIIENGESQRKAFLFAILSLVTGLVRPEGVLLTSFMLLAVIFIKGPKNSLYTFLYYFGIFLVLGGIYFLWRWQYFGYPLPNPFYKKGGGEIYVSSLVASYTHVFFMNMLLLPAFIVGISFKKTIRKTIGFLVPLIGFATCFILIANNMNILGRFQYVILPMAAMVCWPITQGIRDWLKVPEWTSTPVQQRLLYTLLVILFFFGAIQFERSIYSARYYYDGKYTVALMLSEYKDNELRLATSESGLLPLYSEWKSLDTWGLNDQWIAHNGIVTEEYLRSFDPHIIMFHAYFSPIAASAPKDDWDDMIVVLQEYAQKNGYILAAAYGENPYSTEYYYVKPDFFASAEIVRAIREMEYYSGVTNMKQINYAIEAEQ
ncbi:MAG: hypothetical protein H7Y59_17410 [Anaerolineales bacterium]|nr:hypothetical protein [Anaerolineales bacterium]